MIFFNNHLGEFAALLTAVFWTITSLSFESASHKIGSVAVNILRLFIGLAFLSIFNLIRRDMFFPVDASSENWIWLSLSGLDRICFRRSFPVQIIYNDRIEVFNAYNDTCSSYYGIFQFYDTW